MNEYEGRTTPALSDVINMKAPNESPARSYKKTYFQLCIGSSSTPNSRRSRMRSSHVQWKREIYHSLLRRMPLLSRLDPVSVVNPSSSSSCNAHDFSQARQALTAERMLLQHQKQAVEGARIQTTAACAHAVELVSNIDGVLNLNHPLYPLATALSSFYITSITRSYIISRIDAEYWYKPGSSGAISTCSAQARRQRS